MRALGGAKARAGGSGRRPSRSRVQLSGNAELFAAIILYSTVLTASPLLRSRLLVEVMTVLPKCPIVSVVLSVSSACTVAPTHSRTRPAISGIPSGVPSNR